MYRLLALTVLMLLQSSTFAQYRNKQWDTMASQLTKTMVKGESGENLDILLMASGTSECVRRCTKYFGEASAEFFEFTKTAQKLDNMCVAYKNASSCVEKNKCENGDMFEIASKGLEHLCVKNYLGLQILKPCLVKHADGVLRHCDQSCDFRRDLEDLVNNADVQELAADGGNDIALLEYVGPLCTSLMCFLSCTQQNLNDKCPGAGSTFVETALKPIEEMLTIAQSGGLIEMVANQVPDECHPFLDQDKISRLKFFGTNPATGTKRTQSYKQRKTRKEVKPAKKPARN